MKSLRNRFGITAESLRNRHEIAPKSLRNFILCAALLRATALNSAQHSSAVLCTPRLCAALLFVFLSSLPCFVLLFSILLCSALF
jgi:hypothetical protein